jgi:hypothetical protein
MSKVQHPLDLRAGEMVFLHMIQRFGYASHLVMLAKDRSLAAKSRPLLARWQTALSGVSFAMHNRGGYHGEHGS